MNRMHRHQTVRHEVDMLHGSLADKIILFAIPLAVSSILQQLFNSADLAVVGRFASPNAMAAVGSNASVIGLMISLFMGLSVGANVVIGNSIGSGHRERVSEAVHTIICVAWIAGLMMMVVGMLISQPILTLMGAPAEVMGLAKLYLRIYFVGMPAILTYNYGSAILRSKGDSRRPLLCLMLSGVINIGLNLLLVAVFHLHVIGVAVATVVSNYISGGLVLYFLLTEDDPFRVYLNRLHIRKQYLTGMLRIGIPAGLQGMLFSLSNVVIQTSINSFGAIAIAGSTAGQNFEFFCFCLTNSFAQAAVTFTSQNYGAADEKRCRRVYWLTMGLGMLFAFSLSMIFVIFRYKVILFFTADEAVIEYAMVRILNVCSFEILICTYEISAGALRGMNRSMVPTVLVLLGSCAFRLVWVATVFAHRRTFAVLMQVYPMSWIITGIAVVSAYFIISRKVFRRLREIRESAQKKEN